MRTPSIVLILLLSTCGLLLPLTQRPGYASEPPTVEPKQAGAPAKKLSSKERRAQEKAAKLVVRADLALAQGQTAQALDLFQQAHGLHPQVDLLVRIGDCHKSMGNAGRAAFSYRQYLKQVTKEPAELADLQDLAQRMEALAEAVRKEPGARQSQAKTP